MEFQQCLSLLAARPPHSHEDCENRANSTPLDVKEATSKTSFASEPAEDLLRLSPRQLIQAVFQLQEMRVLIYTDFREGFQAHQKTQQFPTFCSEITIRFSNVSEQIKCIEKLLRDKMQQVSIAKLLRNLQSEEKNKLLLTSAVMVEKMRLSDAANIPEPDDSSVAFLQRSVETLTSKHTECVVRINEILEDLRAENADLEDVC
uniref:Uncharacterized protein n=1 Tax=Peronospora matthiolae TaxID=2874970 RepID=A0AAV1UTK3_9STRA